MNERITEIQTRLAAILAELPTATGDALTALETESRSLTAELKQIQGEAQRRQGIRNGIAEGQLNTRTLETHDNQPTQTRTYAPDTAEYREAFLMNLQGRTLNAEQRAAVTATAVIPTQTMNQIVAYLEESPVLSLIDLTHFPSNVSIPVEKTNNEASWVAMGTASTDSNDALEAITLGAYLLIKTVEIQANVAGMSIDAFEHWLVDSLGRKIEEALVKAVFVGTGTNQATGICTTISSATGTFTKNKATFEDLVKIIGALPSGPARNATFAMPRKLFYSDVIGITGTDKKPICHTDVESPAKFNILGYKVILDDSIPKDTMLFGDFKAYKMNLAKDPEVSRDDSVAFRSGSSVYRAMAMADGKLAMSSAFVKFERASA